MLLAWVLSAVGPLPSNRHDALIESATGIEKSDFLELLTKSRAQQPREDIEAREHLFVLKLACSQLEDSLVAETSRRLMFVRLIPKTGPPQAI
jgi:hypothetical protein